MSNNQFVFGQAQCGICGSFIEKPKYMCKLCGSPICRAHRGKRSSGFMGTEYYCSPQCPPRPNSYQQSTDLFTQNASPAPASVPVTNATPTGRPQPPSASPSPASPAVDLDDLFSGIQTRQQDRERSQPSVEIVRNQSASPGGGVAPSVYGSSHYLAGGSSPQQTTPSTGGAAPRPQQCARDDALLGSGNNSFNTAQTSPLTPNSPVVHVVYPTPPPTDACGLREVSLSEVETLVIRAKPAPTGVSDSSYTKFADRTRTEHPKNVNLLPYTDRLVQVVGERRGIILGAVDGRFVWQQRGSRHASIMSSEYAKSIVPLKGCRCKHCGAVVPTDEAQAHVETHRRGHMSTTSVDSDDYGTCCGDTTLLKSLVKKKRLGEGAQGEVWQCTTTNSINEYVMKDIKCTDDADATRQYQKSVRLMGLDHPHLIQYQCVQRHKTPLVTVVMNYYPEGDATNLIRNAKEKLSEAYLGSLSLQIAGALKFMHSRSPPIVHGDIKPENLLMFNRREQVLLMDLDTSKELVGVRRETRITEGTTAWMAPEAINNGVETPASDIWSTGLVIYVLAVLPDFPMIENELFNAAKWTNDMATFSTLVKASIESRGYTPALSKLIVSMLSHNPQERPTPQKLEEELTDIITAQLVC